MSDFSFSVLENRSLLRFSGCDAKGFLQNLVTNDLDNLSATNVLYSALLTPQGKFLHDFFILLWKENIYLDCVSARKEDLVRRLTMYKLRADVTIEDVTEAHQLSVLYGDDNPLRASPSLNEGLAQSEEDHIIYCDPRLARLGYRIISTLSSNWIKSLDNIQPKGSTSYNKHRLALGVPEGGTDIVPEKNFLLESNFEELHGVSFSKGCYVGQELTARTKYRAKIKKRLFQFTYDGVIAPGDLITIDGKEIATVTSFDEPNGLALTRLSAWKKTIDNGADLKPAGLKLHKPDYVVIPVEDS